MPILIGTAYCADRGQCLEAFVEYNSATEKEHARQWVIHVITRKSCPVTGKSFSPADIRWIEA